MQTRIRLARFGTNKKPFYRVVVASISSPRDGRFLEVVGSYDPRQGMEKARLDRPRIDSWLRQGARPTEIVKQMLKRAKGERRGDHGGAQRAGGVHGEGVGGQA